MNAIAVLLLTLIAGQPETTEGRTKVRLLYSFENPAELNDLRRRAEHTDFDLVQDNGVTEGKNCCRVVFSKGVEYAGLDLGVRAIKEWKDFDYFALDLYTEDEHEYEMHFELWDALSKNYYTRCTQSLRTHKGRQTLLYPINRAKRNGKEGREWHELLPQDKIDLNGLTRVRLFLAPRKDRAAVVWIDNLRLMQEDAARPKMRVALPEGAIAFDFGSPGAVVPGFQNVAAATTWNANRGYGFTDSSKRIQAGAGWPDLLTGTFVMAPPGQRLQFQARVPAGVWLAWLAAGPTIRPDLQQPHFHLTLGGQVLASDRPTPEQLASTKYLYRFMDTLYSEKPHALWRNYIRRMYPATIHRVEVQDGLLTLEAENHFLSGLILVPAAKKAEFDQMVQAIEQTRIKAFEQTYYSPPRPRPQREPGDGDFVLFVPHPLRTIVPWSGPSKEERGLKLEAAAARGQRVVLRLAVTPFVDLGPCELKLADLRSDSGDFLSANLVDGYVQNYRSNGKDVAEMALLPRLQLEVEQGVTWCFWLWLEVPVETKPGIYRGRYRFVTADRRLTEIPVEIEVYPFQLRSDIPLSLGMYFREPENPPPENRRGQLKDLLRWMRQIGFTGVHVQAPVVTGLNRDGTVKLQFDPLLYELAREVGMGQRPEQYSMGNLLWIGRNIGRYLLGGDGSRVDQEPGIELRQPEFKGYFLNALTQYRDFIVRMKLPVAVEIVDEPREVPNPWNRNLADTITYARYVNEVPGLRGFLTPMSDSNNGKDYTVLADYPAIVSVHAWKSSAGLIRRARDKGKTLWFYNTGMDRFSWGFYNWRMGSQGRWEWHFSWPEEHTVGGYPGREWYNPFTSMHGFASQAPWPAHPGGYLFQSAYLQVHEGINDSLYLHTLTEAIRSCKAAGRHSDTVRKAEAFLAELRQAIPEFPEIAGLQGEGQGALVGRGVLGSAAGRASEWRAQIAAFLKVLMVP